MHGEGRAERDALNASQRDVLINNYGYMDTDYMYIYLEDILWMQEFAYDQTCNIHVDRYQCSIHDAVLVLV